MKINKFTIVGLTLLVSVGLYTNNRTTTLREEQADSILVNPPDTVKSGGGFQVTRSYNYESGRYNNYSDAEIRMMREEQSFKSDGGYIYTPGRHVRTIEDEIEEYIMDNPEVIEGY